MHSELARLIRSQRVASIGTLRDETPLVSLVAYAPAADFSAFFIHISRLAQHTQDILKCSRVGLMIAEPDEGTRNPQTLARVSLQGEAVLVPRTATEYEAAALAYLTRFPESQMMFSMGDFEIYAIAPKSARFVAGFGKIYNLGAQDFTRAAQADAGS